MPPLSSAIVGSWKLRSREDRNSAGELRVDPFLGADPVGFLVLDPSGNFAVQLMKRDRQPGEAMEQRAAVPNNTAGVAGYDAYFGAYVVDDDTGVVTQTLVGTIAPEGVGRVITRPMRVDGDVLTIQLETTTADGETVTRTLIWERAPGTSI
jgi:hypothetical protein